jgi:hypothetical protein
LGVVSSRRWHRLVDTARPSPEDIVEDVRLAPIKADWVLLRAVAADCGVGLNITD